MLFPSHLYSCVPGRGFGITPRRSHNVIPASCSTYRALDGDVSADRPWAKPNAFVARLGPSPADDLYDKECVCSLLVMRGGFVHDARLHGFAVLDLWPLVGEPARVLLAGKYYDACDPPLLIPSVEVGALLVARALAGAWDRAMRVAVVGPSWALDMLSMLPGAVTYVTDGTSNRNRDGVVTAWGRRWLVSRTVGPFDIASRLSGPSTHRHSGEDQSVGSMLFSRDNTRAAAVRVRAVANVVGDNRSWSVRSADLGQIFVRRDDAIIETYSSEPAVRWPCSEDPWLIELVGDGEPLGVDGSAS